jgi:hypothetical protein
MSTRAGAVAVVIALGLIVLALVLLQSGKSTTNPTSTQAPTPSTPVIAPDAVGALTIAWKGTESRIIRDDRGGWSLEIGDGLWPVDPTPVDALLRMLGSITEDPAAASQPAPTGANLITIDLAPIDPSTGVVLAFSDTPVAGRVLALRDGKPFALADARIVELTTRPGPQDWRSRLLIPDRDARGAARIAIGTGADEPIELARLDGVWRMRRPLSARANPDAVAALLDRLSGVRVLEFDAAAPATPSLDMAAAPPSQRTLELAWDQRTASPDGTLSTRTITRTIAFGPGPVGKADRVSATVNGPAPVTLLVAADVPVGISTAPRNYLADTATGIAPADVGFVRIRAADGTERGFRREGTGWTVMPTGAPTDGAPVEALLRFLAEQSGEAQESPRDTDIRSLVRIELLNFESDPLDFLDAGYTADGVLTLRSGTVVWLFGRQDPPDLLAMPAFESLAPAPETPRPVAVPGQAK